MERVQAALTALAAFHQRLARHAVEGPSPGLAHRLQELRDLQAGGFDALERILTARREIPGLELVRRWLEQARSLAPILIERTRRQAGSPIPLQPCVRDARPEHFLFEANRLTGLVDFGAMDLDSVAADLSRLLAEWFGPERKPRVEALAAYTAIRPLSSVEVSLIDTYEHATALLIGARWTRWAVLEGRGFDPSGTIQDRIGRSLDRLSRFRELQWST
jgi:homoserine kinase type II